MMSVEDLRLLVAIDSAGSLSAAARQLGIDHSTAFRRLGAMESRLGVRLFERARDGYTPTPAGETAVATAGNVSDLLAELDRRLAGHDQRPSGVVRLTTPDTLIELLAPMLAAFRTTHPAIMLEVVAANPFFTLTRRDADVALRIAAQAPEGLVARRIANVATALYAARGYRDRHPAIDAAAVDWLSPDESLAHLGSFRWMQAQVPAERIVATGNSLLFLRAAAAAGLGVAPLPCYLGDADPALERLGEPLAEATAGLWLITHPDLRRVARVRALLDFAASHLRRQRSVFDASST